jgi:HK97 family phage major capsid protein
VTYNTALVRGSVPTYDSTPATHPLINEDAAKEIIKNAVHQSVVMSMFKHRNMGTAQTRLPVLAAKATGYFVSGEIGLKQTTRVTWDNKFLDAEEIAAIVPIPEKLLDDTDYDIWAEVKPEVEEAIGVTLDAAVLFGYNKPASWPSSIVAAAIAASNTVTQGAGIDIADDINSVMTAVEIDGYEVNGFFMRTSVKGELRGLRDSQGAFIFQPPSNSGLTNTVYKGTIYGEKATSGMTGLFEAEDAGTYGRASNSVKMIAGDWTQGILGIRQDMQYRMLDQAVITDNDGRIVYNLPQQSMVALMVTCRMAFQVPNPINRQNTNSSTRYPFAVLYDAA